MTVASSWGCGFHPQPRGGPHRGGVVPTLNREVGRNGGQFREELNQLVAANCDRRALNQRNIFEGIVQPSQLKCEK